MFIIVETKFQAILGDDICEKLQLIKWNFYINLNLPSFLENCYDYFGEIGTLRKTHRITVDSSVPPGLNPPRKIPFALKKSLKEADWAEFLKLASSNR